MLIEGFDETIEMPIVREQSWAIEYNGLLPVRISWSELAGAHIGAIWTGKHRVDGRIYECSWKKVAESGMNIYVEFTRKKLDKDDDYIESVESIQIIYAKLIGNGA